jgi:hypothetical protein
MQRARGVHPIELIYVRWTTAARQCSQDPRRIDRVSIANLYVINK